MRPLPISDELLAAIQELGPAGRTVIGDAGDPTRDDLRPVEYVVVPSDLYPGRPAVLSLIELDDDDRAAIAAGSRLWLRMDGSEVPWSLTIADPLDPGPGPEEISEPDPPAGRKETP